MSEQEVKTTVKKTKTTKAEAAAPAAKTAKKPAVKKADAAAAPKVEATTAAPKKTKAPAAKKVAPEKAAPTAAITPTPEERYRMVETAAYFIAERSGFSGNNADHWIAAELEIAQLLGE